MVRHNNQLPTNLPQLQNLLKRDPSSYKDEVRDKKKFFVSFRTYPNIAVYALQFLQQYRHYKSTRLVFEMQPDQYNKSLDDLVMFLAQVYNILLSLWSWNHIIFIMFRFPIASHKT